MKRKIALKCLEIEVDSLKDLTYPDEFTLQSAFQSKKAELDKLISSASSDDSKAGYKTDVNNALEAYALLNLTLQRVGALKYLRIDSRNPTVSEIESGYKLKKAFLERAIEAESLNAVQSDYKAALAKLEKAYVFLTFSGSLDIPLEEENVKVEVLPKSEHKPITKRSKSLNRVRDIISTVSIVSIVSAVVLFFFVYKPMQHKTAERIAREEFIADSTRLLDRLVMSYFLRTRHDIVDTSKSVNEIEREIRKIIADSISQKYIDGHRSSNAGQLSIEEWEAEERQFAEADSKTRDRQYKQFARSEAERSKQLLITNRSDMKFVKILGGTFNMGSDEGSFSERPVHQVNIEPFYLGLTEVTHGQWTKLMPINPSQKHNQLDNYPIENVSWEEVQEYIQKLNEYDRKYDFRLPSEAEWEYACRAGMTTHYNTGKTLPTSNANYDSDNVKNDQINRLKGNSKRKPSPVGNFAPNQWGLYDMHGNVWEWCQDWFYINYTNAPTDGSSWDYPKGTTRIIRGGGYYSGADDCRSEYRLSISPSSRHDGLGFRLVLIVE